MKFLVLIVVPALAAGWIFTRSRRGSKGPPPAPKAPVRPAPGNPPAVAQAMLVCAHCQVHLPQDEAQFDVAGHPYCSAEHRVAGPR
jgi:uncharacterized protein